MVFLAFTLWILFIPFRLLIQSEKNIYVFHLPGILKFSLQKINDNWKMQIRLLFFNIKNKTQKKKSDRKKKTNKKSRKFNALTDTKGIIILIKKIIKTLKIKRFKVEIDTGNYTANALLIPVIPLTGLNYNQVNINFNNHNNIDLQINGQLFYLALYGIIFYIKKKIIIKNYSYGSKF